MCKLGLIDFIKQSGTVVVHNQGSLSNETYQKILGARSTIKNFIKDTNYKVDFYDSNNMLDNISSHRHCGEGVRVVVSDLLSDKFYQKDIYVNPNCEQPFLRRIYETIDLLYTDEKPINNFITRTRKKYELYLKKLKGMYNNK